MNLEAMSRTELISTIDDLQSQIEALRSSEDAVKTINLQSAFNLTEYEGRLLFMLSDGKPRTKEQVMDYLYFDKLQDPPEIKIIDVWMCRLRAKVKGFGVSIETIWGVGYQLTEGMELVSDVCSGSDVSDIKVADEVYVSDMRRTAGHDKKVVLSELIERADREGVVAFQTKEIKDTTGVIRGVSNILTSLESRGLVDVIVRASNHSSKRRNWIVRVTPEALGNRV